MVQHGKHPVYPESNNMFTNPVNGLFSLRGMNTHQRPIDRALARAKELGMDQAAFAEAMGVDKQHVTNWKRRGMPGDRLERAALVLKCSSDYLLGLTSQPDPQADTVTDGQANPEELSDEELDMTLLALPRELKISLVNTVRRARQPSVATVNTVQSLQTEIPGASDRHGRRRKRLRSLVKDGSSK
jgi:transcriptional regulator with XRE-family HTH domain